MKGPLEGIRVLECGMFIVGPLAASMLGDLGAEVIKVEDSVRGDPGRGVATAQGLPSSLPGGRNYYFEVPNRSKRAITVNITKPEGQEVIYRLIKQCDVFIQNFRPGVAERNNLDYATLSKINPKLVYASASGYGSKGPDATLPAIDMVGLARGGWMTHCGEAHHPPLFPGNPIADQATAQTLCNGILAALVAVEKHGVGQQIETSMLASVMAIQSISISGCLLTGRELSRPVRAKARNPLWSYYRCADDRWVALGMSQSDRYWKPFCDAIGKPEMGSDPKYDGWKARAKVCEEIIQVLDEVFATKSANEWIETLRQAGDFLVQPVKYHAELVDDPQVIANEYIVDYDHSVMGKVKLLNYPVNFSKTPAAIQSEAPEFGQNTEEVLLDVGGYTWEEIANLKENEII